MKRCPECLRNYTDETLNFCLDDGARLVDGPLTGQLDMTVIFPTLPNSGEPSVRDYFASVQLDKAPPNTIAVLPFLNLVKDEDGDYFSDGLAEELLNVLSKIKALRVAARTSAFSFKGKQTTIAEIGQILNVASVLEGSIRKSGKQLRISVQLVKVSDGYHLWSETYDRAMDDIFAVQDDIARSVVEEIRVRLLGDKAGDSVSREIDSQVAQAVRGRSHDPEAQRLMLLGRHFLDRTTREDTAQAISYFEQALKIDPDYALGWAELGRAYSVEAGRGWIPVEDGFKRSREATLRALAIEPELAEGHAQLGRILATHDWNLREAESSYRRALELAPGSSSVLDGASVLFYKLGRLEEAQELGEKVLQQDPLSAAYWHNLGLTYHAAGKLPESENAFRRALELAPQRLVSRALLALVLLDNGKRDEAVEQAKEEPDEFWRSWSLAIVFESIGDHDKAHSITESLVTNSFKGNSYQLAEVFSMRDDVDEAFKWLGQSTKERDPGLTHAKVNPRFRNLYKDRRWQELLESIGLMEPSEPRANQ